MNYILRNSIVLMMLFIAAKNMAQQPVQYMDKINNEFKKISDETWDYTRAVAHNKNARLIEGQRKQMLIANRNAMNRIKNMPPFSGSTAYRDSTLRYLELCYWILNNDYSRIVDMEEVAEQSYDAMEAYMLAQQIANEKMDAAFDVAIAAHERFAAENNIQLIDGKSKTNAKLEKAGEVFGYYNKLYLVFFKPYKQEAYLLDAQLREDVNAMKQNQEALSRLAKEAKIKLGDIVPYQNNTTLKAACSDVLDFYVYEADMKFSSIIEFYLKKEQFEKLKKIIEKKGKNVTATEATEYNISVAEFNKATNDFNKTNSELNSRRKVALEYWNNAVSRFLDRNVSRKK